MVGESTWFGAAVHAPYWTFLLSCTGSSTYHCMTKWCWMTCYKAQCRQSKGAANTSTHDCMLHNVCMLFWLLARCILQTTQFVQLQQTGLNKHHTSISSATAAGATALVHCHLTCEMYEDELRKQTWLLACIHEWTLESKQRNKTKGGAKHQQRKLACCCWGLRGGLLEWRAVCSIQTPAAQESSLPYHFQ